MNELDELPIVEKLHKEMNIFLDEIEGKHNHHKADLLNLVRGWRKEIEKTLPTYQTFKCRCIEQIPFLKSLLYIAVGAVIATIVNWLLSLT